MHPSAWAYYSAGADDEVTLRREREAFERLRLVPRVLRGVDHADTSTTVLGTPIPAPIMVAQTGVQAPAHPEGGCAPAPAAADARHPARPQVCAPARAERRWDGERKRRGAGWRGTGRRRGTGALIAVSPVCSRGREDVSAAATG